MKYPLFKALIGVVAVSASIPMVAQTANPWPGPKNLMSLTYRAPAAQTVAPHDLTDREAKRLAATAKSPADHLKLVEFYTAKAKRLEAQAAGYEQAAAAYMNGPKVKNLMSPTTPGRYEFFAKNLRNEAKSSRALAATHEQLALVASH